MKKKLLYASPFGPLKSGISDYSEILIYGLREYFDVTLLIDSYKLSNKHLSGQFDVKVINKDRFDISSFDYKIYNIGNNPHYHSSIYDHALKWPGVIILHDYVLYFLSIDYYRNKGILYSKIYEMEGAHGLSLIKKHIKEGGDLLECKELAPLLPMNKELINASKGILVHSEYTKRKINIDYPSVPVLKIEMVDMNRPTEPTDKDYLKKNYGIQDNDLVIASFGYVAPTKLNHIMCDVVVEMNRNSMANIYYVMVGDGDYVDHYLKHKHILKTGFAERSAYEAILQRCDLVANLRFPTMGETSISLIHAMSMGKPCVVCDDAWFAELPDNVVFKVDPQNVRNKLHSLLTRLFDDKGEMSTIAVNAKDYIVRNHSVTAISSKISGFLADQKREAQ